MAALLPLVMIPSDGSELPEGARLPLNAPDAERWFAIMAAHGYTIEEMAAATGLPRTAIPSRAAIRPLPRPADRLFVLPYPGGRHPRIGFLDGALDPQRETKISVFTPWNPAHYVVADVPEAIWWHRDSPETADREGRELLYLAHTHVPTYWERRGIHLEALEWQAQADGSWTLERRLPNGITFGTRVTPRVDHIAMEQWITNGTTESLTDLRVQNCVMLKGAPEFEAQSNDNKVFAAPYAACRDADRTRWIITAWEPCVRTWGNANCPCLHSDPQFPDCPPGETRRLKGWLSFFEGVDVRAEFHRIEATGWRDP
ncbi:MAG: hypothetical protein KDK99_15210 [Verrucomicrobiales bacterium]|nr:hypothetical protein [Verrucomicrobiales bacterium]